MPDMLPVILDIIRNGSVDQGLADISAVIKERERGDGGVQRLKIPSTPRAAAMAICDGHQPTLTANVRRELSVLVSDFFIDQTKDVAVLGKRDCLCGKQFPSPETFLAHIRELLEAGLA